jgi:hypothetical protein
MIRKSDLLSNAKLDELLIGATVLEQGRYGLKVLRLQSGDILKIFRVKNILSISRVYSYARGFCRNASRLEKIGIPTVNIKQLFHLEKSTKTAVLYAPVEGLTLRELLDSRTLTAEEAKNLGAFFATLHAHGVHFRSIHPGNIVLGLDNAYGLIDIADMRIYPWSLWCNTRCRSFKHFCRYPAYVRMISPDIWQHFEASYFFHARLSRMCKYILRKYLKKLAISCFG